MGAWRCGISGRRWRMRRWSAPSLVRVRDTPLRLSLVLPVSGKPSCACVGIRPMCWTWLVAWMFLSRLLPIRCQSQVCPGAVALTTGCRLVRSRRLAGCRQRRFRRRCGALTRWCGGGSSRRTWGSRCRVRTTSSRVTRIGTSHAALGPVGTWCGRGRQRHGARRSIGRCGRSVRAWTCTGRRPALCVGRGRGYAGLDGVLRIGVMR